MRTPRLALALALALAPIELSACLWDTDTLQMERQQFPSALELMTGKFLRHSTAYYRWRVADRTKKLAAAPEDLQLLDDLAVAHDKLGQPEQAIALMQRSARIKADRYETEANLGTFLIHAGQLEDGLAHIKRAIAINPDAHFGRERYQQRLVEYVLARKTTGALVFPLRRDASGFAEFLAAQVAKDHLDEQALARAIKGILGMMRFGHFDHPILLEALADLLSAGGKLDSARRLAARAYLKASWHSKDPAAAAAYRARAEATLSLQQVRPGLRLTLADVEPALRREVVEGERFAAAIAARERSWIEAGQDLDAEFAQAYYAPREPDGPARATAEPAQPSAPAPRADRVPTSSLPTSPPARRWPVALLLGLLAIALWGRNRRRNS